MPSDPTPAVPMDPEFREKVAGLHVAAVKHANAPWGTEEQRIRADECDRHVAALWAAVVAYGDRRAEEARGVCLAVAEDAVARFTQLAKPLDSDPDREPVQQYVDAAMGADFVADWIRALSSPAPEGVERGE